MTINCYSNSYSPTRIMCCHVYIWLPPHNGYHRQPVAYRMTDVYYMVFVNKMHSVRFYFINTTV